MTTIKNKIKAIVLVFLGGLAVLFFAKGGGSELAGFASLRGFSTLESNITNDIVYDFGVVDIPLERAGAASSSTGFEFGKFQPTTATAFTVASTSNGFAVTVNGSGRVKGCAFYLQSSPTTGTVSLQVQLNETLQTGKYCKMPSTSTFATNGGIRFMSKTEAIGASDITFVSGDRLGLIASSSNLNAATVDGWAKLIIQLDN